MDKVLITGATGFVGRHCLAPLLCHAGEVHAVARSAAALDTAGLHLHAIDLLDARQVTALIAKVKPSHLLHLAWITTPGTYWTSARNLDWLEASLHLVRRFVENGGRRAVLAGSCAEYDWTAGHCHETATPLRPASLYGVCKNALRDKLNEFAQQAELSWGWGRLFFLYGPHEHPRRLVASVIRSLLAGVPARCSSGTQQRDVLHVRDAAEGLVALLRSDVSGAVNIASGEAVPVGKIIERIAEVIGRPELVRKGAVPAAADEPPLVVADVRRLCDEVRWSRRYSLEQGLADTIDWWRSRIDGNSRAA
jgi:nucleoside-diphosphate-sugar epimerase